jgi:glycosyltransferase involved in cell wall biosynthesis
MVIFGDEWGLHPTSVQYLARGLAKSYPLLYVNTFWQRRPRLSLNDAQRAWHKVCRLASTKDRRSTPNIAGLHFHSPALIPFKPVRPVRNWNRRMLVKGIQQQLLLHGFEAPILFAALPLGAEVVGALGERLLIYYVMDEYAAMPGVYSEYIKDLETLMLAEADLIFVTSSKLQEEKNGRKTPAVLLPHGVDFEHFHSAATATARVPEELRHLPRPLLGFCGTLAPWVDPDILTQVSRAFPRGSVVLIGPQWIDFSMPKCLPNLHWLGPRPYSDLPSYAAHFDVGLIPFRQDRLTAYVNPLKLLEYLALGIPVVSTPLPDLARFEGLVLQAKTADDFIDQVKLALADRAPERRMNRFALAAGESWEARVNTLQRHIEIALRRRTKPAELDFSLASAAVEPS